MESHFEKILFMQIYTYISLIETTDYYFKIRIYVCTNNFHFSQYAMILNHYIYKIGKL